ncbi:MAG: hypothetical protein QXW82_01000 [Candidatus Bathyarchaeia archaeon]
MKRQLSIVLALIHNPQIIFLDEPSRHGPSVPPSRLGVYAGTEREGQNNFPNNPLYGG